MEGIESENNDEEEKKIGQQGRQLKIDDPKTTCDDTARDKILIKKRKKFSKSRFELKKEEIENMLSTRYSNTNRLIDKKEENRKRKREDKIRISNLMLVEKTKENINVHYNKEKEYETIDMELEDISEKDTSSIDKTQDEKGNPGVEQSEVKKVQEKRINKMKVMKYGKEFKYEEIIEEKTGENEKEKEKKEEQRFKGTHTGDIIIEANATNKYKSKSRTGNMIKIASKINRTGIRIEKIKNLGFNRAEIKVLNIKDANRLLDLGHIEEDKAQINFRIPKRVSRRKGVIMDWDQELSIMELVEAIPNKENIISLERMKSRYMDQITKEVKEKYLDKIIVTYEGEYLPRSVNLYDNTVALRMRPFIEPVRQCFNCFKFGHKKEWCKADRKCINCGDREHGRCEKDTRCANCEGMHKATFKRCPDYEQNWMLKKTMVEENVSIFEARELMKRNLQHQENLNTTRTRDFPELRRKESDLLGYRYREEDEDINKIRSKGSYADLVRKETSIKEKEDKRGEDKRGWYEKYRTQTSPVLGNKRTEEDRKGNYYYKDYNNREEDITKERYGLVLKKRMEQKEETSQDDKIEQIIERVMEKNKENIDKIIRSQERRIWEELEARINKLERKIDIQDLQFRTDEEKGLGEKRQENQN